MNRDSSIEIVALNMKLLKEGIDRLYSTKSQYLTIPFPQPRIFSFTDNVYWPRTSKSGVDWYSLDGISTALTWKETSSSLVDRCKSDKQLVRLIYQIKSAQLWVEKRAKGRKRHIDEMERQQSKTLDQLKEEYTDYIMVGSPKSSYGYIDPCGDYFCT